MEIINQLISSLGFPIAACIAMAWYVKYKEDNTRETLNTMNKQHTEEMLAYKTEMTEAINNNTMVMNKLILIFEQKGVETHENVT